MTAPKSTTAMDGIIALAKAYAVAKAATNEVRRDLAAKVRAALRSREVALRNRIAEEDVALDALKDGIDARRDLFEKPRTRAVQGVKFGLRKQPGSVELGDEAKVIERIRKHFPDLAGTLIVVKWTVDKRAIAKLPARDLAKLGVAVVDPVDKVTISAAETDADKLADAIKAFLLDEDDDMREAA